MKTMDLPANNLTNSQALEVVRAIGLGYCFNPQRGGRRVLREIDLEIRPGELVMVTGPSGSGKTTLLTLIGALRSLQEGRLNVLGHDLDGLDGRRLQQTRRHIGFIFQNHNLFEALTAVQTLRLAMQLFDERYTRMDYGERPQQLLDSIGMAEHADAMPCHLSTGQKQRIAIARALINEPRLILADEPTAALDHDTGQKVMALLRNRVVASGAAVMMVTHDQRLFAQADRVLRMEDGQIVREASNG